MSNFSVLLSIYHKENPKFFDCAMTSIALEQSLKPNEIILVRDGFLTPDLDVILDKWANRLSILRIISLDKNIGLGGALAIGMDNCSNDLIARMDTDDISQPDRFKMQVHYMQEHSNCDIVGSNVTEFSNNSNIIVSSRLVPSSHTNIIKEAQIRSPFNHPSVMYRKSAVIKAGGYKEYHGFEDYYLWVRMIQNGARCANISEPLVSMRTGYSMLNRRSGISYAVNEVKLQYKFLDLGFITWPIFLKNLVIRIPVRLLPSRFRFYIYKLIRN